MYLPRRFTLRRRLAIASALVAVGCSSAETAPPKDTRDGTQRMADTLAVLYRRALANPEGNPFLSKERADRLESLLKYQTGPEALNNRFALGTERLVAGQPREAIETFERLKREAMLNAERIDPDTKQLFDLEALAYLRIGEQQNCLDNPAANICIIPFDGPAKHAQEEGARGAIAKYTTLLRNFPDDRGSQWLLNLAYMALGQYPEGVPRKYRIPNLKPRRSDAFPTFTNVAGAIDAAVNGLAGGVSIEDFNGDGHLDIFTTSMGLTDPPHLFLADGNGRFTDATAQSGIAKIVGGLNVTHGDYDNDGDIDLFVLRGAWMGEAGRFPNSLLRNLGDGRFEDVTFAAGLLSFHPTQTAAWADFNLDGFLDLFVGNESQAGPGTVPHPSELYVNNRDGTFSEISRKVGIDLNAFVKGAAWGDVNNDGLPDLFVSVLFGENLLFMNLGGTSTDTWRFGERSIAAKVQAPIPSFPTWFWDYDQDGWEDLLVLSYDIRAGTALHDAVAREYLGLPVKVDVRGFKVEVEHSRLYRNEGDGTFADVTRRAGLADKVIYAMGSNFGDLDNDGWLDFYVGTGNPDLRSVVPNRMFRSVRGQRFEEVTIPGGFGHIQKGHATAFADLDRDGDQDVYMVMGGAYQGDRATSLLFENPGWEGRSWIVLELEGKTANRSAIGARVQVDARDAAGKVRTFYRTVRSGGSFGAGPLQMHIGLDRGERVTAVRISWPDAGRSMTTAGELEINRYYRIVQGDAPRALDRPRVPFRKIPVGKPHTGH
jgi:tetratricopeptide (TPR) repeat protein